MKYIDKLYQKDCIFEIRNHRSNEYPSIMGYSLKEAIERYNMIEDKIYPNEKNNEYYIPVRIYNLKNFTKRLKDINIPSGIDLIEIKKYLDKWAYLRELRISLDCSEIYSEQYFMVSHHSEFPYFDHCNYFYDYYMLYDDISSIKSNIGKKFTTEYMPMYRCEDENGERITIDNCIFKLCCIPNTINKKIQYPDSAIYCTHSYLLDNNKIVTEFGLTDVPIPASTMKFL